MTKKTVTDQIAKDKKLVEYKQKAKQAEELIDILNDQLDVETDPKKRDKIAAKLASIICGHNF